LTGQMLGSVGGSEVHWTGPK